MICFASIGLPAVFSRGVLPYLLTCLPCLHLHGSLEISEPHSFASFMRVFGHMYIHKWDGVEWNMCYGVVCRNEGLAGWLQLKKVSAYIDEHGGIQRPCLPKVHTVPI